MGKHQWSENHPTKIYLAVPEECRGKCHGHHILNLYSSCSVNSKDIIYVVNNFVNHIVYILYMYAIYIPTHAITQFYWYLHSNSSFQLLHLPRASVGLWLQKELGPQVSWRSVGVPAHGWDSTWDSMKTPYPFPFTLYFCPLKFLSCIPFIWYSCPWIFRPYVSNIQVFNRCYVQTGQVGIHPNAPFSSNFVIVFVIVLLSFWWPVRVAMCRVHEHVHL